MFPPNKSFSVRVHFTAAEFQALARHAEDAGVSLRAYCLRVILREVGLHLPATDGRLARWSPLRSERLTVGQGQGQGGDQ